MGSHAIRARTHGHARARTRPTPVRTHPSQAAPDPAPEPEFDREAWLEKYAGAGAIGSDDLMGNRQDESGLARKLAGTGLEATKKLGGLAASVASSWLSRGNSGNGKSEY